MLPSDHRRNDAGFTLIELLVVILIIGILAAIAIPAFLHQRAKAQDADAKTAIVTAVKAMETYRTDHDSFDAATRADLEQIEPSLRQARNLTVSGSGEEYDVSVESASQGSGGGPFRIHRDADGRMDHLCDGDGRGACLPDGTW